MTFSGALECLKDGHAMAREGWNGKGMWLELQERRCARLLSKPLTEIGE